MTDTIELGPFAYRPFALDRECQENHGHTHNYDHMTFVQAGSVQVFGRSTPDGEEQESRTYKAGEFFLIPKDMYHRIKAMEPNTRYVCMFAHRDGDGLVTQEYQGYEEAYV